MGMGLAQESLKGSVRALAEPWAASVAGMHCAGDARMADAADRVKHWMSAAMQIWPCPFFWEESICWTMSAVIGKPIACFISTFSDHS